MSNECLYCKKQYNRSNENSRYCSKEHYQLAKKIRQKEIEALVKEFRRGIYKNHKTFSRIMPEPGNQSFPILKIKDHGFDENAFYKTKQNIAGLEWHSVNEYYFNITIENGQAILNLFKAK